MEPKENVRKFINQAGVQVRDHVPISIRDWHKPKNAGDEASYVNDILKTTLWNNLLTHFTLPESLSEDERKRVKEWTLKKMAKQFQTWKIKLWAKYEHEDPKFIGRLEKIEPHWAAFKAYKKSSTGLSRSVKNKENAGQKKYFHHLGSGGYKSAIPKWKAYERELKASGVDPQTWEWPDRSKFWLFAHGAA